MERRQLTINLETEANTQRYFDDEMTLSARRVVPLAPLESNSRQTWKICLVAGVALLCGVLGGLALGLRQSRVNILPEVIPTPVSATEASAELPVISVPETEEVPAITVATPALTATPSPTPRATLAAKTERETETKSPAAKSDPVTPPVIVNHPVVPSAATLNNGLVRPRRAAGDSAARNFPPKKGNPRTASSQLSLAEQKP